MKKVFLIAILFSPLTAFAAGDCTTKVLCGNGEAACSAHSFDPDENSHSDAVCGMMNAGDRFKSCALLNTKAGLVILDAVCCDAGGNALHLSRDKSGTIDTSKCAHP